MLKKNYFINASLIVFILLSAVSIQGFAQQKKTAHPVAKAKPATTKTVDKSSKNASTSTPSDSLAKKQNSVSKTDSIVHAQPVLGVDSISKAKTSKKSVHSKKASDSLSLAKTVSKTESNSSKSTKKTTPATKDASSKKTGAKSGVASAKAKNDSLARKSNVVENDSLVARTDGIDPLTGKNAQLSKVNSKVKTTDKKGMGKTDPKTVAKKGEKPKVAPMPPTNIITKNAVGVLKLGASIDTIKKLYPKERVYRVYIYDQNNRYVQYQVMAKDKVTPFLNITQDCVTESDCLIKQILVKNPYFKTDRDIVVGNTLDDLFLAYGYLGSRWEEENLIVSNEEGLDFIMDTSQIPKRWYKKMNLDRLPLPTKIVGIQISIVE